MKIITEFWMKPVPTSRYDWTAWYENCEESRCGYGSTEEEAVKDLMESKK